MRLSLAILPILFATCACKPNPYIAGGSDAPEGSFPHHVALFLDGDRFICGGSLIAPDTVLTAAHCVYKYQATHNFTIQYGSLQLGNGTSISVTSTLCHPQFSPLIIDYDVALLRLSSPIILGPNAGTISLASSDPLPGTAGTIVGFGLTSASQDAFFADHLQFADKVTVMERLICKLTFDQVPNSALFPVTERTICLATPQLDQVALGGDSGGSLVIGGRLAGVTSFGLAGLMADNSTFGISAYMSVAKVKSWIEDNVPSASSSARQVEPLSGQLISAFAFMVLLTLR